jgi:hypothetical protein
VDEYLHRKDVVVSLPNKFDIVSIDAAYHGYLEVVIWAYMIRKDSQDSKCDIVRITYYASIWQHIAILKWVYATDPKSICLESLSIQACNFGLCEVMKWVIKTGYVLDHRAYRTLVFNYRISILEWLRQNDPNWNHALCSQLTKTWKYGGQQNQFSFCGSMSQHIPKIR